MFHQLAQDQIEKFTSEGIVLSPSDVIRINDAAAALADARSHSGGIFGAPRCRWCGGVLFHEPTVQSELWMMECASALAANDESWGWMLAFSLVHADEPDFFEDEAMRSAKAVNRRCRELQRVLAATRDEVWAAVNYCRFGREIPGGKKLTDEQLAEMEERYRAGLYADLAEAVAITGCGPDELRRMTCPMLERVIRSAWEKAGRQFKDAEVGARTREWYKTIGEISSYSQGRDVGSSGFENAATNTNTMKAIIANNSMNAQNGSISMKKSGSLSFT